MSFTTPFGKRKVYLINHDPINHADQLEELGLVISKFLALQTINEFRDAVYNDFISGELFISEEAARRRLYPDEYFLELFVPVEAISQILPDGHLFINAGYAPKILSLKTADHRIFKYDELKGFYIESQKMTENNRRVYNYNPDRWPLFSWDSSSDYY